ncbi:MAG: chemotaxis protein CheW [Spirochaetales bacterium]|nr:chemotaxis protein CheW [Spirochaetales bacterium]
MAESDKQVQLVTFQLGEEQYGIEIMSVDSIVRIQEIRPIPNAPAYVEGIFNLRGDIIPVINLHKRFHLKKANLSEDDEQLSGFIVIEINGMKLAVVIDKVSRVVAVEVEKIQPPPQMISGIGAEYIQGVYNKDDGYLIILDIDRLFDPKELKQLGDISK